MSVRPFPDLPTRICVFASTTIGDTPAHLDAARTLATAMHTRSMELVYGGGTTGMMGEMSKTLVRLSGKSSSVRGIIPEAVIPSERPEGSLQHTKEKQESEVQNWSHHLSSLTRFLRTSNPSSTSQSALLNEDIYGRTTIVPSLSARKHLMCAITSSGGPGSGFIALSGGFGTMDELMEMITLRQQGVHRCRICLYNIDGFWDLVLAWMDSAIKRGFVREEARSWIGEGRTAEECLKWLAEGEGTRGFDVLI